MEEPRFPPHPRPPRRLRPAPRPLTLSLFRELARLRVKLAEKKVELAELLGVQLDGMSVDEEGKRLSPPPV
ncbi:hypothetical protein B9Q08_02375 [Candidatus Marsarchaeota G2 archaeon ECH_B_SAG-M15]|uniref:Uncharacterized protein n=1 Tax=Candidatus Marsarchaeota G2 archaeon ECH_B_SAG-M15 TaxID=1978162 RepID=A0A2R6AZ69_9ARCH|nr:MAG: hypothetical protein B9Q08_02375 [Candidatus Marsarchaeota G2 archaeon ECH_B_SAG-M15]